MVADGVAGQKAVGAVGLNLVSLPVFYWMILTKAEPL